MKIGRYAEVVWKCEETHGLLRAWRRLERDLEMRVCEPEEASHATDRKRTEWVIGISPAMEAEEYRLEIGKSGISVTAGDELGVIYALLFFSERFLGVTPFWYWNDQQFDKKEAVTVSEGCYLSPRYRVRFRGWFINDEVLLDAWGQERFDPESGITENFAWEMAMEALLRLGGNMVIPGTDFNSHKYRKLAADMGLWITHHHAEPLGAQMFSRAYPELVPSFREHPELFRGLWDKAIEEQKDCKVIWNLGFRGQGDRPFWADDESFDTPEKRGELISRLILEQYNAVARKIPNPVCCTNLYGEVMELYQQGLIQLPENVIYIWADNGYGKMVSRRQGNHNPRVPALPEKREGKHGMYYHASFYDLQAASHITMLPNSDVFVTEELERAYQAGAEEFLVVNCSNVKPHAFMLDAIARTWGKQEEAYTELYFPRFSSQTANLYRDYFQAMLSYGPHEDDHAGEQFYHYTMRAICHGWMLGRLEEPEKDLVWLTGVQGLTRQTAVVQELVEQGRGRLKAFYEACTMQHASMQLVSEREARLFADSLLLQATLHHKSAEAELSLCEAYGYYLIGKWEEAFVAVGNAAELLQEALSAMDEAGHGKWKGFYDNDCLTDVKFTVYMLENVMSRIRAEGDGPHYYQWARKYTYPGADTKVVLLTNTKNHPLDWELYLAMKGRV